MVGDIRFIYLFVYLSMLTDRRAEIGSGYEVYKGKGGERKGKWNPDAGRVKGRKGEGRKEGRKGLNE